METKTFNVWNDETDSYDIVVQEVEDKKMKMKLKTRIFDIILGVLLIGLSMFVLKIALSEMIFEAVGWYDLEDWLWSIFGSILFGLIGYVGIKMVVYPMKILTYAHKTQNEKDDLDD